MSREDHIKRGDVLDALAKGLGLTLTALVKRIEAIPAVQPVSNSLTLPEYVEVCPVCNGAGEYEQTYTAGCGGGYYRSLGPCECCTEKGRGYWKGCGYVYKETGLPIPRSVWEQIKQLNT